MKRRAFLSFLGSPLCVLAETPFKSDQSWEWPCMGSHFKARFQLPDGRFAKDFGDLKKATRELLEKLELTFSVHRPDSEALTLCRKANAKPGEAIAVSETFFEVTLKALEFSKATQGYFDITVGSLTNYWRYCSASQTIPDPKRIALLKKRMGSDQLRLKDGKISFHPTAKQVLLDYGGIAKGDAADRVSALFKKAGLKSFIIDLGGEIVAHDAPPERKGWEIILLDKEGKAAEQKIFLKNRALSTSGDLYQSIRRDGQHLSHIVSRKDPAGLKKNQSITVLTQSGLSADCLATAAHAAIGTPAYDEIVKLCEKVWAL